MNYLKIYITAATLMLSGAWSVANAQVEYVEDDDDDIVAIDDKGDEEVIEVPEAMMQDLDSLLLLFNNKTYLKIDENCNMRDINPFFEPEVIKDRLMRMPTLIEMPYNDMVQKFIDRYAGKLRRLL